MKPLAVSLEELLPQDLRQVFCRRETMGGRVRGTRRQLPRHRYWPRWGAMFLSRRRRRYPVVGRWHSF